MVIAIITSTTLNIALFFYVIFKDKFKKNTIDEIIKQKQKELNEEFEDMVSYSEYVARGNK